MMVMWKSFELIDEIVGGDYSRVIPGHDALVFEKGVSLRLRKRI